MKKKILIITIFVIALAIRLVKLDTVPIELFGDELDAGYQAYSILKTGKDIRGYKFPIYFHSLSESKAPVYLYTTVPFVAVFGLNEWGVRLPAVFFGMVGILFIYLLAKELFSDEKIATVSLLICSILPWHIQYSRAGLEETLLMTLVTGGIYFFLKSFRRNSSLLLSVLFFGLSVYTYPTAVIFTPIIFLILILIFRREITLIKPKLIVSALALLALGSIPFLMGISTGQSQERFFKISIFSDQKSIDKIILKRANSSVEERIFHNKLTRFSSVFLENYLTTFSPQFLFLKGDPAPRHNSGQGQLLWSLTPFLIVGFYEILKQLKDKKSRFLLLWLLSSPIASSLTSDGATHAGRLFIMIPPLVIMISLGLARILALPGLKGNFLKPVVVLAIPISFVFYLHQYYVHYPKESWQYWQYGYKGAMTQLREVEGNYDRVILNNNHEPILLRLLFWGKVDPLWFRSNFSDDVASSEILPGFDGFKVGKYYIGGLKDRKYLDSLLDEKTLYLAFQGDEIPGDWNWMEKPPAGIKVLSLTKNPLGDPYLYLLTGKK